MRLNKNISWTFLLLLIPALGLSETSEVRKIEKIQIEAASSPSHYYFVNQAQGWGAPGCPNAIAAYFSEDTPSAKEMFSLALVAKATGANVQFKGTCTDDTYFNVNYMYLE